MTTHGCTATTRSANHHHEELLNTHLGTVSVVICSPITSANRCVGHAGTVRCCCGRRVRACSDAFACSLCKYLCASTLGQTFIGVCLLVCPADRIENTRTRAWCSSSNRLRVCDAHAIDGGLRCGVWVETQRAILVVKQLVIAAIWLANGFCALFIVDGSTWTLRRLALTSGSNCNR